jgi:hypothetical protein
VATASVDTQLNQLSNNHVAAVTGCTSAVKLLGLATHTARADSLSHDAFAGLYADMCRPFVMSAASIAAVAAITCGCMCWLSR